MPAAREAAFAAIAAQLEAQLPRVTVERNRRAMIGPDEPLPIVVLRDGGHEAADDDSAQLVRYSVECVVEGFVADTDARIGAALNDLHARCIAALCNRPVPMGDDALWLHERRTEVEIAEAGDSAVPAARFVTTLSFDLLSPFAGGPFL
jgi:hypothetical protein